MHSLDKRKLSLAVLTIKFLNLPQEKFNDLFSIEAYKKYTGMLKNSIFIHGGLMNHGLIHELFSSQKEFDSWEKMLISVKNEKNQNNIALIEPNLLTKPINGNSLFFKPRVDQSTQTDEIAPILNP